MGDSHMGLQARLMSQALRKLAGAINRSNSAVVFINQLREKIGVMFGNPETTTGGKALKFYASLRLDIRRIGPVKERETVIGNHVRVKVVKNKVAPPFRQAEFDVMFDEGISHTSLLVDLASEANIIQKSGAWYSYGDQRIGQGRENAKLFLRDNPPLMTEVEGKVKELLGVRPGGRRGAEERTMTSYRRITTVTGSARCRGVPARSGSRWTGRAFGSVAPEVVEAGAAHRGGRRARRGFRGRLASRADVEAAYRTALRALGAALVRPARPRAPAPSARATRPRRSTSALERAGSARAARRRGLRPSLCPDPERARGRGPLRLARDLAAMGVERGVIDRALAAARATSADPRAMCRAPWRPSAPPSSAIYRRRRSAAALAFLARRGYAGGCHAAWRES